MLYYVSRLSDSPGSGLQLELNKFQLEPEIQPDPWAVELYECIEAPETAGVSW